ncbi:unnamed protein product [Brassica rapa]|uniref:Uncharacterized protein n=1 Tax=Brassica campestris TaxID=3711 RepID=A0A8D9M1N9_BRACM|nr:unnamed protein product [Brassica rapa]
MQQRHGMETPLFMKQGGRDGDSRPWRKKRHASELTTARSGATSESFHGPLCDLEKTIEDFWYVKKIF